MSARRRSPAAIGFGIDLLGGPLRPVLPRELVDDALEGALPTLDDGALVVAGEPPLAHQRPAVADDPFDHLRAGEVDEAADRVPDRADRHVVEVEDDDVRLGTDSEPADVVAPQGTGSAER